MRVPGVAVSGLAGDGKDTLADVLVEEWGFLKDSLAFDLKVLARDEFGWDGKKDVRGRRLLQKLGTEAGRTYDPDIWVKRLLPRINQVIEHHQRVVVPDARFQNELQILHAAGFLTVLVVRGGFWERIWRRWGRRSSWHASERDWRGWDFDVIVYNTGSVEDFRVQVRKQLAPWLGVGE